MKCSDDHPYGDEWYQVSYYCLECHPLATNPQPVSSIINYLKEECNRLRMKIEQQSTSSSRKMTQKFVGRDENALNFCDEKGKISQFFIPRIDHSEENNFTSFMPYLKNYRVPSKIVHSFHLDGSVVKE